MTFKNEAAMDPTRELSDYGPTIENWVRDFINTMDSDPEVGDRSGDEPLGVKIIFDGYGYNEETNEEDDKNVMTFAVFVHKDSLNGEEFPEHEFTPWALVHRPKEEVCIHVAYFVDQDSLDFNGFEDGDTELDHEVVYQLIRDLEQGNYR
jgi:hypothetical protein